MKLLLVVTLVIVFGYGNCDITSDISWSRNQIIHLKEVLKEKQSQLDQLNEIYNQANRDIQHLNKGPSYCNCRWTGYLNYPDEVLNYIIPDRKLIRGLYSVHSGWFQDRRWMIQYCSVC